jgi:hypothetical protein
MSVSIRGFRGKNTPVLERKLADLPENIGNQKTYMETKIPPDDVGNKIDNDPIATFVHDGLGNSLDDEPAHLNSGVLMRLLEGQKWQTKKNYRDYFNSTGGNSSRKNWIQNRHNMLQNRVIKSIKDETQLQSFKNILQDDKNINGDQYMAKLAAEFSKLLKERSGLAFSFLMRPMDDPKIHEEEERKYLYSIQAIIIGILNAAIIEADVTFSRYGTNNHRFAVFFINPKEQDPLKNKYLISALRQVIKIHMTRVSPNSINILLVLANAQSVIEEHLYKIGARKISR